MKLLLCLLVPFSVTRYKGDWARAYHYASVLLRESRWSKVSHSTTVLIITCKADRAEKRKWLRHCPAASNVGSSARSFKMIGIIAGKKTPVLKVKK